MLAETTVQHIEDLLAEGKHSQRKIARMLGVSRGSVNGVATGKRRVHVARPPLPWQESPEPEEGPPRRCHDCGAMVQLPCQLCHVRDLLSRMKIPRRPVLVTEPLGLKLKEEDLRRYIDLRRRLVSSRRLPSEE